MRDYDAKTYGAAWAADYDRIFPSAPAETIDCLAAFAEGGRVLELAIGTGRVALPLAARGVRVSGVDISEEMVKVLRSKPGGADLEVAFGDFAEVGVEGDFRLVYLVANTLFGLLEQGEQIACFRNVANRLEPGGRFLIEAFVPDLGRFDRGQRVQASRWQSGLVALEASVHRPDTQRIDSHYLQINESGVKVLPVMVRYSWPAEIDLMARLAGLDLEHRWAGWDRSEFGPEAQSHVSVYRKPSDA